MKINKVLILITFIVIFLFGIILGFYINNSKKGEEPINFNPFPKSCQYSGKIYKTGDSFKAEDGCNSCGCNNGEVVCTMMACE